MDTRIVWFRRDLRLADNEALAAALPPPRERAATLPLFVLDPALVKGSTMSPARLSYLCDALAELDRGLRDRGGWLVVRGGDPRTVVPRVAEEFGAREVHWAHDVTPYAASRDAAVRGLLEGARVDVRTHPGIMIHDHGTVVAAAGRPSRVYTPFRRAWEQRSIGRPLDPPVSVAVPPSARTEKLPAPAALGITAEVPEEIIAGGESAARERFERFLAKAAEDYGDRRNLMGEDGTSRLSADLHYGCLSPRAVYVALDRRRKGHRVFAQELVWRDFYGHVMAEWPEARTSEFNPAFRFLPWRGETEEFRAWQDGRTGYPIVDAGMRQLLQQGWMHNRARMITASFLCKDLLVDWRLGEAHFLRHLVDGDVASNNGGWQWAAGTGTDAQPYFRIFNPVTQGERFDPEGNYVRRFVPELEKVPAKWIHHPWEMPAAAAQAAGVKVGRDYPAPIVDHRQARAAALEWFRRHRRD